MEHQKEDRVWILVKRAATIVEIARVDPAISLQATKEYLQWRSTTVIGMAVGAMTHSPFGELFEDNKTKEQIKEEIYHIQRRLDRGGRCPSAAMQLAGGRG